MTHYKMAFFDWNGTLFDDRQLNYKATRAIFDYYNLPPPTLDAYLDAMDVNFREFFYQNGIDRSIPFRNLRAIRGKYLKKNWRKAGIASGTTDCLQWCCENQITRVLISADIPELIVDRLKHYKLAQTFNIILAGIRNKQLQIEALLESCEVLPENAFIVDDLVGELRGARKNGLTTIGSTWGHTSQERIAQAQPTYVINSLAEIPTLLEQEEKL